MSQYLNELLPALAAAAQPGTVLALPPTDGEFVRAVYQSVLGRTEVDSDALAFWTDSLAAAGQEHADEARAALIHTLVYSPFAQGGDAQWSQSGEPHASVDLAASLADIEQGVAFTAVPTQASREGAIGPAGDTNASTMLALVGQADPGFALI